MSIRYILITLLCTAVRWFALLVICIALSDDGEEIPEEKELPEAEGGKAGPCRIPRSLPYARRERGAVCRNRRAA